MKSRFLTFLTVFMLVAAFAAAQTATTGQISGVVSDPAGAVVPGAQVSVVSETGVKRSAASDAQGRYILPLLPPGNYRLEVAATGFRQSAVENVVVKITAVTDIDVQMGVATTQETVTIAAEVPLIQSENATRGEVIQSETLRQLPLPTRNFQQLLTLTAGTSGSLPNSSELGRGDTTFNVNGQRSLSNAVVINGVDANSIGTGSTPNLSVPTTDSLQEFIVQTSLYDASQGRNVGGVVAAVTKSGTNSTHGNAYWFGRFDALNANNYFLNRANVPRPEYRRNQFGGTLGGPVWKDRTWYFLSYQGTRETNGTSLTNSIATVFVPGNLSNDRSTAALNTLAASFGVAALNPTARFLLQATMPDGRFVIPSAPNPGTSNAPVAAPVSGTSTFREDQFNANLDHQITASNRISGKFFWANNPTKQALFNSFGTGNALPLPGFGANVDFKQRLISLIDTHIFTPNIVNDARAGYSRITTKAVPEEPFTAAQIGVSHPLQATFPGMPTISVSNYFDVGASPFSDNDAQIGTWTIADTLSWRLGNHSFKIGGDIKRHDIDLRFDLYTRGNMFHLGFSGNPFRDFLGGFFGLNGLSIMGSGVNNRQQSAWDASWFVNDDWKVSPRLTLNYGVRWDYYGPLIEDEGRYVGFDPRLTQTVTIPGGVAVVGGFVQAGNATTPLPGMASVDDSLVEPDYNNYGTRFGFAWQPFSHTNKFVIRGGHGFYFDRPNARLYNNQVLAFPYYTLAQVIGAPIATPFVQVPQPSAFPLQFNNTTLFPSGGPPARMPAAVAASACAPAGQTCVSANGLFPDVRNFRMPYVQQYNLGIQWEFAKDFAIDLGYVGASGRKLHRLLALNQGTVAGGNGALSPGLSALAAQGFGVHVVQSSGNSRYDSLQATLSKRMSKGLQFISAYTYSIPLTITRATPPAPATTPSSPATRRC